MLTVVEILPLERCLDTELGDLRSGELRYAIYEDLLPTVAPNDPYSVPSLEDTRA
jgi:hypothetical protein